MFKLPIVLLVGLFLGIGVGYLLFKEELPQIPFKQEIIYRTDSVVTKTIDSLSNEISYLKAKPTKIEYIKVPFRDSSNNIDSIPAKIYSLDTLTSFKDTLSLKFISYPVEEFSFLFKKHPDTTVTVRIRDSVFINSNYYIPDEKLYAIGPSLSIIQTTNNKIEIRPGISLTIDIFRVYDKIKKKWPF